MKKEIEIKKKKEKEIEKTKEAIRYVRWKRRRIIKKKDEE